MLSQQIFHLVVGCLARVITQWFSLLQLGESVLALNSTCLSLFLLPHHLTLTVETSTSSENNKLRRTKVENWHLIRKLPTCSHLQLLTFFLFTQTCFLTPFKTKLLLLTCFQIWIFLVQVIQSLLWFTSTNFEKFDCRGII